MGRICKPGLGYSLRYWMICASFICWNDFIWKGLVLQPIYASPVRGSISSKDRTPAETKMRSIEISKNEKQEQSPSSASKTEETIKKPSSRSEGMQQPESLKLRPRVVSLNIMVAGLAGLGKTTLCRALLDAWWQEINESDGASKNKNAGTKNNKLGRFSFSSFSSSSSATAPKTTSAVTFGSTTAIRPSAPFEYFDERANTILRVRIIDTPGFGNRVNHRNSVKPITDYISSCRLKRFRREQSPSQRRPSAKNPTTGHLNDIEQADQLVHVCLYFLSPGRFLAIDRHFLKQVQEEVTIVPVIAKADTLTDNEIARYRAELDQIWRDEGIQIYSLDDNDGESDTSPKSNILRSTITSGTTNDQRQKFHRGRRPGEVLAIVSRDGIYPWGDSCALDPEHSDLVLIRDSLLSEHTERFLALASQKYSDFRNQQLAKRKRSDWFKYFALIGLATIQLGKLEIDVGNGKTLSEIVHHWVMAVASILPEGSGKGFSGLGRPFKRLRPRIHQRAISDNDEETLPDNETVPIVEEPTRKKKIFGLFGTPSYESITTRWKRNDEGDDE